MSRRDSSTRGNGTSTNYDYDAASRLILLTQELTGTAKDLTRSFTHNAAGQIRTRSTTGTAYDYQAPIANKAYVPDGLNRYATVASTSFTYDANGNLTFDGTRTFLYDVENRLIRVTMAGVQTDLSYDPLGRLYSVVTGSNSTQFLYDGDRLVAEYGGSPTPTLQRRYVHGPGVDEPVVWYEGSGLTTRAWLHSDERGSIIATSDSGGNGTEYKYGPYGEPTSWSGVRFRYTGQIALPELQLYHYKARVYDPVLGRFLQTDPVGYQEDANLYAYVRSDPLNAVDPSGTAGEEANNTGVGCGTRVAGDFSSTNCKSYGWSMGDGGGGADNDEVQKHNEEMADLSGVSTQQTMRTMHRDATAVAGAVSDAAETGFYWYAGGRLFTGATRYLGPTTLLKLTRGNFRSNMIRRGGFDPGLDYRSHHGIPVEFDDVVMTRYGINVHDPVWGVWVPTRIHSDPNWHRKFNLYWQNFLGGNPSKERVQAFWRLMNDEFL